MCAAGKHACESAAETPRRLALVGAGALGSAFARQLVLSGLALDRVLVIDPDDLEAHNVSLSRVFHEIIAEKGVSSLGRPKADLLAHVFRHGTPWPWVPYRAEIADVGWQDLQTCDLLVSCTDSALARAETAWIARCLRIPVLDGGVFGAGLLDGRVSWFPAHPHAACPLCALSEARRAELLAYASAPILGCRSPEVVSMGSAAQIPASLEHTAAHLVRSLRDLVPHLSPDPGSAAEASWAETLGRDAGGDWQAQRIHLQRSATCPWHDDLLPSLVALEDDTPLAGALCRVGTPEDSWRLQFPWPICLDARCGLCGHRDLRPQRLAFLRRRGVCPHCGPVGQMQSVTCVTSVGHREVLADRTPRQLGLPNRHLLQARRSVCPPGAGRETS